jgi:hypothetical protein
MVWNSDATIQEKKQALIEAGFGAIVEDHNLTMMLLVVCREILGYGPATCKKELYRYFNDLVNSNNMAEKISSKYRLKEGQLLYSNGQHYSNANLTDEIAEALLKNTPALKNAFEVIPKKEPDQEPATLPKQDEPVKEEGLKNELDSTPVKKTVSKKTTKK